MKQLTYTEAMAHIRKYKDFFKMEAIAKQISINPDQFRQVVRQKGRTNELPKKYRTDFIEAIKMLMMIEQIDEAQTEVQQLDQAFRNSDLEPF